MMEILLCCQYGASTAMVEARIAEEAKKRNLDVKVQARPYSRLNEFCDSADIILLGPQMGYKLEEIKKKYPSKTEVTMVIDYLDYGMMDGASILDKALALLEK
jgi:Phosphotransferase system cellobiose-specific component IIB